MEGVKDYPAMFRNKTVFQIKIILLLSLVTATARATAVTGLHFEHRDWELACDNTRTCRAAGYQEEGKPVSMLLTRKAGQNTPVSIKLQALLDSSAEEAPQEMRLQIGELIIPEIILKKELPRETATKLLAVMPDAEQATLRKKDQQWQLSLAGIKAVLLKMDEFQGRIGTPGALIRKGNKPEAKVLPPIPQKPLIIPPIPPTTKQDKEVLTALENFFDLECEERGLDLEVCKESRSVYRLSNNKLLVSQLAWQAFSYNQGVSFWLVNDKPPYQPERAEGDAAADDEASEYEKGIIYSALRGARGDCWNNASWVGPARPLKRPNKVLPACAEGFQTAHGNCQQQSARLSTRTNNLL
ncbi:MAG: DUF1176 domain-containing protein [Candidatus Electrothrix scaldis]|nr:MAG: DUF1176 domain-containing protein [Candidatus Electrothrix sp. GW3-3]